MRPYPLSFLKNVHTLHVFEKLQRSLLLQTVGLMINVNSTGKNRYSMILLGPHFMNLIHILSLPRKGHPAPLRKEVVKRTTEPLSTTDLYKISVLFVDFCLWL